MNAESYPISPPPSSAAADADILPERLEKILDKALQEAIGGGKSSLSLSELRKEMNRKIGKMCKKR